jgi:hypothetical protein
LFADV